MPLTETLQDNFDAPAVDAARWPSNYNTAGPLPDQPAGRARVPCSTGFAAYASANIYTLAGSQARVRMFPAARNGATNESFSQLLVLSSTVGTQIVWEINTALNIVLLTVHVGFIDEGGRTVPYDPEAHAWARIREEAGTLYWEASPDGRAWTVLHTDVSPGWVADTDLQLQLLAHRDAGGDNFAEFDDFNITPVLASGYLVAVDWAGSGDFDGADDNVTTDVLDRGPVTFAYGRDQTRQLSPPMVGSGEFGLCNAQRIYSPENPDSPISDEVSPASPVRVEVAINDTLYPLFAGRINEFTVHPDRDQQSVDIGVLDDLSLLEGARIYTGLYEWRRTGELMHVVLDRVGWDGPRDIDVGATHVPWWWAEGDDAFSKVVELLQAEGPPSIAYVAPDGTFTFRDRHHRLLRPASVTSQASFAARAITCDAPAVTGSHSYLPPFDYSIGWKDIVNAVTFEVEERRPSRVQVVWESESTISLSQGQSTQIHAQAEDPFFDAQDLVLGVDIVVSGAGVAVTSLSRRSGQSLIINITAAGGAVSITRLQVRARPVPVARTVQVTSDDSVSIARHGRRSYGEGAGQAGQHDAFAIGQLLLAHYAQRSPTVQLRLVSSDLSHLLQIVTRTLSDRITIRNGELGLDRDFFVERISQTIRRMRDVEACPGPVHYAELGCESSGQDIPANPFIFDKTGAGFDDGVFDPTAADNPAEVFIFDHPTQGQFGVGRFGT
ncbi:hypothetical protein QNO07_09300 [Streptomyces sp. 549]|uniref:hypothetical protein n=1 Tax=Streptomyces sp. 549 TaxID=3049076 RepID=UPI0024C2D430|nr:hypothetical protein [Streptomyces sp. 549]MDK1473614.1 hypothetical protein [Streptomyces sp. 549]